MDEYKSEIDVSRKKLPRSPHSELGRYRHYGEMPKTEAGLLLALRDTMTALLDERCKTAGITRETAQYRVWYATDPAFRAKEKAKSAGRKATRESTMQRDGTLTPEVVRRLFATASMCPYCDRLMTSGDKTLDHMTPVSLGGVHGISNVTVCCYSCNSRKRNMPFAKWLTKLPPRIAARFTPARAA
jgi:5-methylcytosine-specific restriction endonuclease McrA